jgi:radical SAM-linked protein
VLERAWRAGARFDGWDEHFNLRAWENAFRAEGIDPEYYAYRDLDPASRLPWHVIDSRINRKWLEIELKRALSQATLSVCGPEDCHGCAPFARDCVKGTVAATTGRPLDSRAPLLSTPAAPGPGRPATLDSAPPLLPLKPVELQREEQGQRTRYRYRARLSKTGRMRFLGHLDLSRLLMRAMRRAGIALAYSQGFNPKPKVAFGPALPVGVSSEGEYLDFEGFDCLDPAEARSGINAALPAGVRFEALESIGRNIPALGEAIRAARYRAQVPTEGDLATALEDFCARGPLTVRREKNGKVTTFDLGRELLDLEKVDGSTLRFTLAHHADGASVRPEEVLREIFGERSARIRLAREELLVDWKGRLINPLLAAAASHAHRAVG